MGNIQLETGARMQELRQKLNLRQADVAKHLQLTTGAYQNYENGRREAGYDVLIKLADLFHTSVDYLLGRTLTEPHDFDEYLQLSADFTKSEKCLLSAYSKTDTIHRTALVSILREIYDRYNSECASETFDTIADDPAKKDAQSA